MRLFNRLAAAKRADKPFGDCEAERPKRQYKGSELPPYKARGVCVKCGSEIARCTYLDPRLDGAQADVKLRHPRKGTVTVALADCDVILRECGCCGYVWLERPLDAAVDVEADGDGETEGE